MDCSFSLGRKGRDAAATCVQPGKGRFGSLRPVIGGGRQGEGPETLCPVCSGERREGERRPGHLLQERERECEARVSGWLAISGGNMGAGNVA